MRPLRLFGRILCYPKDLVKFWRLETRRQNSPDLISSMLKSTTSATTTVSQIWARSFGTVVKRNNVPFYCCFVKN